ncbi:MAG: alpha-2-macroglobulin family protein, partial [Candidatus Thorarchaeota archaeon]
MVKLYARVPTEVSQEGSLIRFFNGQGEKIKIKEVNENKSSIFSILSHKSQSKYIANSSLLKYEWLVSNNDKFNNVETEHIGISLNRIKSEYLGVIWIPKNLYRPGDIIKGYIFLRKRREASKESIQLVETDPSNPITIELKDAKNDIVHVSPIMKTSTPIIYFEIPVDQYTEIGPYSLELKRGKDSLNKIKISLSLYEKPDIKLSIHMPNWSLAGTNIPCEISANYFFGEPVKEGKLTISSNAWESDIDNPFHENIDLELPDCLPGEYSINFELTDKVGRKVNEIKQIKIVKEPLQIEYALFPLEKPIIESQHVEIVLKIMDPLGIPLSKIRVKCLINSEQDKNSIVNNVYYSDENGYIKIDLNSLSFGKYTVEIMTVNEEINVKLIDSFEVRKVASTDIWLSFSSLPNKVLPGERITGKIIIEGPGQKLIDSDSIFLDCISDKVYDSQELKIINNNDFGEAEFKIDIPTNYFGQIVIEAYFSPSLTEILEKKLNTKPKDWVGETFELGKLSTKKILDINYQKHKIDFQVNTPSEITTGTNFDINIQLSDKNLSNKIWYGVFLSDERILYEFQPVRLKDSFYSPKNLINVVNIGSVLKFPPMPAIAERSRSLGGYPTTYMRNDRFNRGYLASLRSLTSKMMIEDINKRQKSQLTDSGEQKIVEEKIIRQIFRTEFPEDIVLEPKLLEKKDTAINIKSPDSITTYKIICVVCSETEFGIVEKKIVVRNPIFTSTLNPPEMILSDDIYIPTVIENLSKSVLEDIEISASTNENLLLQEKTVNIPRIAPYSKHSVFWNIIAQKVGNAQLTTYLKTKNFSELSELERPLRIQPPGTPHKTFYHTKLLSNKPWEQEINITGNEAFNLIIINFLPGLDLAIIEGVESLVSYPYGCCEQTSASTLPNPIAYRYLESNNKLTKDIQVSLIRNMQTGLTRYLNIFHNKENGGFGLWDGKRPSIFHTSLVLSVLGRIKDFIEVPDIIFEKAKEFLSSKQFQDGSYEPESGIDKNFPTTLTKLSMTAYVV